MSNLCPKRDVRIVQSLYGFCACKASALQAAWRPFDYFQCAFDDHSKTELIMYSKLQAMYAWAESPM